jgi:hypothetical protein
MQFIAIAKKNSPLHFNGYFHPIGFDVNHMGITLIKKSKRAV